MTAFATEGFRTSHLVKQELFPENAYCREVVVYNGAAKTFVVGELVAAAGAAPAALEEGDDVVGIVMQETVAPASTNTRLLVLARGPAIVSKAAIVPGLITEQQAVDALVAKGIMVADAV
jgi:hypothetical protein